MTISEVAQQNRGHQNSAPGALPQRFGQGSGRGRFTGSHRHWTLIDLFSASAMTACYQALKPENQSKFNNLPIGRLVELCFRSVA